MTHPDRLSLTHLLGRISSGALTSQGAVDLVHERVASRDGAIGAFAAYDRGARASASGPLAGIAVGIKDVIDTADFPTGMGSSIYDGWQPKVDAPVVAELRRLGATIVGKTTTTAFATNDPTTTRNPIDPAHTPGGSSAGSAAAVGGGMLPLALGTQTAGSVIRPASYCGAAAIKPSFRLLPTVGVKTLAWTLDTLGLFAAGTEDLRVGLAALSGRDLPEAPPGTVPRLGLVTQDFVTAPDPDGASALAEAVRRLTQAGAEPRMVVVPALMSEAWAAQVLIQDFELRHALASEYERFRDGLAPNVRAALDRAQSIPTRMYDEARRIANRARGETKTLFAGLDAIVTLSAPGSAPRGLDSTGDPRFNRLWTLLGTPCVNVPGLTGAGGLPVGIQVIAPFGRDAVALSAARFVEACLAPAG